MTRGPSGPSRYLAFEAGVLRRLAFESVAMPFAGAGELGWYLKLWRKRVFANDLARRSWWACRALVENNAERLDADEAGAIVAGLDAAPRGGPAPWLSRHLAPADAAWLGALRDRVEGVEGEGRRGLAIRAAFRTIDYALAVPAARDRALALGDVFTRAAAADRPPVDTGAQNRATNADGEAFVAQARADLLYVRFPGPGGLGRWRHDARGLHEAWLRGGDDFWGLLAAEQRGRFGGAFESKRAYLDAVDRFLATSSRFPMVAVAFVEDGWISAQEMAERLAGRRRVRVAYSRDFTAAAGGRRAHILVAV